MHDLLPEHARDDQEMSEKGLPAGPWRGGRHIADVDSRSTYIFKENAIRSTDSHSAVIQQTWQGRTDDPKRRADSQKAAGRAHAARRSPRDVQSVENDGAACNEEHAPRILAIENHLPRIFCADRDGLVYVDHVATRS